MYSTSLIQCHYKPLPLLLPLQVHLGNQQTIIGLITFQTPVTYFNLTPVNFNYLLYVVVPVLAAVVLGLLLVVAVCCVCVRRKARTKGDR